MESKRTQKTFVETFGEAHAATVESGIFSPTGRLRGQRPQLQKIRIRNDGAGGDAATEPGTPAPVSTLGLRATSIKRRIGNAIVPFAPTGQRIPAQGIALGTASQRIGVF
jgi:hypothetical protein